MFKRLNVPRVAECADPVDHGYRPFCCIAVTEACPGLALTLVEAGRFLLGAQGLETVALLRPQVARVVENRGGRGCASAQKFVADYLEYLQQLTTSKYRFRPLGSFLLRFSQWEC